MGDGQYTTSTRVFDAYARYYDLLYQDKDYAAEAQFVHKQLLRQGGGGGSLLELGCGTGRHAMEFANFGYSVEGVDLSENMVQQAMRRADVCPEERKPAFKIGDVRTVRLGRKFDTVVSLFHVMSYQTTDADLQAAFRTAAHHLNAGGLFLFDFWYGPAVRHDPPVVRVKRLEDDAIRVTRLAEPQHEESRNLVSVDYNIFLKDKSTGMLDEISETHSMRYLFLPEMRQYLEQEGFAVRGSGTWLTEKPLGQDFWYGWLIAQLDRK
jgi:SAM-dependent methyltransferase